MADAQTDRQRGWLLAAEEEATKGNDFGAALFALIAQPTAAEAIAEGEPRDG